MKSSPILSHTVLLLASFAPLAALGQSTPAPSDEVVELSPFSVRTGRDYGYQASNSITATGIGTPIKDIPANINVITQDFLKDKNAGELRYAIGNVSSANADNRDTNRNTFNIRGFDALLQQDGADGAYLELDNAERIEVVKGPSAVFHGIVRPGGVINVIKAQPDFTERGYAQVMGGSYNYSKFEVQKRGVIIPEKLAYLVYGSFRDQDRRVDYSFDRVSFGSAVLKWVPVTKLTSTLRFEAKKERYEGIHSLPVSHPAFVAAVKAGQVPYLQDARTWLNSQSAYGPNEPLAQIFVTEQVFPSENFNPNGPDAPSEDNGYAFQSNTTLTVTDDLNLKLFISDAQRDASLLEQNTFRPVAGRTPGELIFNSGFTDARSESETLTMKLEASYKARFAGMNHSLLAGALDQWNNAAARTYTGPVVAWNPWTEPARRGREEIAARLAVTGKLPLPPRTKAKTRGYYVTDQIALLSERLRLLIGARYTKAENAAGLVQTKTTPQFGALVRINDAFGVYANYSETFEPNYLRDGNGVQVGPTEGKGSEVGLKIDALDSKLSGSVAVYQVERANIPRRDFPTEALTGVVPLYILGGLERNKGFEADFTYSPTRNYQLIASYTHSWEHRTIASTGDVRQIGVPLANVPRDVGNLWNKYTFVDNRLKGFAIGAGMKASSGGFHLHPSWDVPLYGGSYVTFDAMLSYEKKIGSRVWTTQLNLQNLTSEKYNQGVYLLSDPLTAFISVRVSF